MGHIQLRKILSVMVATSALGVIGLAPAGASTRVHTGAPHLLAPTRIYHVTTASDVDLSPSAPEHRCEDSNVATSCSFRAAVHAAENDFGEAPNQWDEIIVPAGDFALNPSVDSDSPSINTQGTLSIVGAGSSKSVIDGVKDDFDNPLLYVDSENVTVSLSDLTFKGGVSEFGGSVEMDDSGLALNVTNCVFESGHAIEYGGAIYVYNGSSLNVRDSTFLANSAEIGGGAILDASSLPSTYTDDTFSHNTTTIAGMNNDGGALRTIGPSVVQDSTFLANTTLGAGGAIYANGDITLSSDTFHDNTALDNGGAVYAYDNDVVTDSIFSNNSSDVFGGGVFNDYLGTYSGDAFSDNGAENGGDIYVDYSAVVSNSTFKGSVATAAGGSFSVPEGCTVSISNSLIAGAQADGMMGGGGAIFLFQGFANLHNVVITGSKATGSQGDGGAIDNDEGGLLMDDSDVTGNRAVFEGGGIYDDDYGDSSISGSLIASNVSDFGGGIENDNHSLLTLTTSMVENNNSTIYEGGGVGNYLNSTATITNSTISHNKAQGSEGYGGGFSTDDGGVANLTNDTIDGNVATYAGGIYLVDGAAANVSSSTITGNLVPIGATTYGSAEYNNGSTLTSSDSIWAGNEGSKNVQCVGTDIVSLGYNIEGSTTCGLTSPSDSLKANPGLGVLANNGGFTLTAAPLSGSLAIGHGGQSCSGVDQRGVVMPKAATCDVGSVFVEATTTTLKGSATTLTKGDEQHEKFTVKVSGTAQGAAPTGTLTVGKGALVACTVKLVAGKGANSNSSTGTCSLAASELAVGTYALTVKFLAQGAFLGSTGSLKVTVKS